MPARVPIAAAKGVARSYGLRQVILAAWDGERTHVVTFGVSIEDCDQAALGGNKIKKALGWPEDANCLPSRVKALQAELARLKREGADAPPIEDIARAIESSATIEHLAHGMHAIANIDEVADRVRSLWVSENGGVK